MSERQRKRLNRIPDPRDAKPKVRPWLMELPDGTCYRADDPNKTPMTVAELEAHHFRYGTCITWSFVDPGHKEIERGLSGTGVAV